MGTSGKHGWMTSQTRPTRSLKPGTLILYLGIPAYLLISVVVFFTWVNPSLVGDTDHHIAADSGMYMRFAKSLKAGENDPFVMASLASFPNTLWGPVLIGVALNSTVAIMAFDYAVFILSIALIVKSAKVNFSVLMILIFANVTTSISLLSLNKEITDLLAVSLFIFYLARGSRIALFAALFISMICRYETAIVILIYLIILSRWNPFRHARKTMLIAVSIALSFFLSAFLSGVMEFRLLEANSTASSGGLLLFLDTLQTHYLFFVAVIPKILDNLFSELVNVPHWPSYSLDDPANSFFLLGNNLATLGVILYLLLKRRFSLSSNLVYYACLSAIFMSTALIIQPRYFFGAYIMLCVEAARLRPAYKPLAPIGEVCVVA